MAAVLVQLKYQSMDRPLIRDRTRRSESRDRIRRRQRSQAAAYNPPAARHQRQALSEKGVVMTARIDSAYTAAKDRYAEAGVDTDAALARLAAVPISLHCWQGDDVEGFEKFGTGLGGGLAATGNYPGKARTPDDLRSDASLALSMIPGTHRFNLHASTASSAASSSSATRSAPSTSPAGSTGPRRSASASTSTRPTSRIRRPPTTSRCPTPTRRFGRSGSTTVSPAGASAPRWARRSASRASPISGSPTA